MQAREAIKFELAERLKELQAEGKLWKRSGWSSAPISTWK
jgi:hypothetical protein